MTAILKLSFISLAILNIFIFDSAKASLEELEEQAHRNKIWLETQGIMAPFHAINLTDPSTHIVAHTAQPANLNNYEDSQGDELRRAVIKRQAINSNFQKFMETYGVDADQAIYTYNLIQSIFFFQNVNPYNWSLHDQMSPYQRGQVLVAQFTYEMQKRAIPPQTHRKRSFSTTKTHPVHPEQYQQITNVLHGQSEDVNNEPENRQ